MTKRKPLYAYLEDMCEGLVLRPPVEEVVPVVRASQLFLAVHDAGIESCTVGKLDSCTLQWYKCTVVHYNCTDVQLYITIVQMYCCTLQLYKYRVVYHNYTVVHYNCTVVQLYITIVQLYSFTVVCHN